MAASNKLDCNKPSLDAVDEDVKPVVPDGLVKPLVQRLYELNVTRFSHLNSYEDVNFYIEAHKDNSNVYVKDACKSYVLKIFNKKDSQRPALMEAQHLFMAHLKEKNINSQEIIPNCHGSLGSIETIYADNGETGKCGEYWVELRTFIPGQIIVEVPYTPELLFKDGEFVAQLRIISESFKHPFYATHTDSFSMVRFPKVRDYLFCVGDVQDRELVRDVIDTYVTDVSPKYSELPTGCIHGDLNQYNILVQMDSTTDDSTYCITGILDYTDVTDTSLVTDLAINIAHLMIDANNSLQLDVGGHVIAGYRKHVMLTPIEMEVLPVMVAARLCQDLVLSLNAHRLNPENTYLTLSEKRGWPLLRKFWNAKDGMISHWQSLARNYKYK